MIITTSICANYLDKALVLVDSIRQHVPSAKFVLCLVEETLPSIPELQSFDKVVLAKDLGIPHFHNFIFQYDIVEASTAVKGHLMSFLLELFPDQNVIYIDPDCQAFSDFTELKEITQSAPIVLAPHLLSPGNVDMEISSLKHGVFNLGFLALKPCDESRKFAKWWGDRLYHFSLADFNRGLFTDQKWINLAPCFFNVHILRHPGYDFATWTFLERQLSGDLSNGLYVDGQPLRFVHFSGFDSGTFRWAFKTWGSSLNQALGEDLAKQYEQKLAKYEFLNAKKIEWSYGRYINDKTITKSSRHFLSSNFENYLGSNPFEGLSPKPDVGIVHRIKSKIPKKIRSLVKGVLAKNQ